MNRTFLDFEGSTSYPFEVAWSRADATIASHLISPVGIEDWTDWSPKAERLHGLTQSRLRAEGRPPRWVCEQMTAELEGQRVCSDHPDYDGQWLERLFTAAGRRTPPGAYRGSLGPVSRRWRPADPRGLAGAGAAGGGGAISSRGVSDGVVAACGTRAAKRHLIQRAISWLKYQPTNRTAG